MAARPGRPKPLRRRTEARPELKTIVIFCEGSSSEPEWPKNHPKLLDAVELAQARNIRLAISNPCFELWLILHHRDYSRFADTDVVQRESRLIDGRPGKGTMLTTQEAADLLNISRPTLVRLLADGEIGYTMRGRHRRVMLRDVLDYRERTRRERRHVLDRLAAEAEDDGLYEVTAVPSHTR